MRWLRSSAMLHHWSTESWVQRCGSLSQTHEEKNIIHHVNHTKLTKVPLT